MRNLPSGVPSVLLVTSLTWVSWFPSILYNTDWMGREVYHGDPKGTPAQISAYGYDRGVREGAFGLLLNSILFKCSLCICGTISCQSRGGRPRSMCRRCEHFNCASPDSVGISCPSHAQIV